MIDNRIINGGFDTGGLAPFTGSGISIDSANSHTGSFSARLASGTSSGFISQLVPVAPGENFEFFVSLAKIGTNNSPQISIVINYLNSSGQLIETALMVTIPSGRIPSTNSDNWLEIYKTTSIAPASTTQAQVVIFKIPQSFTANVVIDDVTLLAVTGGSSGPVGDLNVSGNLSVGQSLDVNGSAEFQGITSFFGPFTVFVTPVFADNTLQVGGSEVIGSGSIQGGTLELSGFLGGGIVPDESLRVHNGHIALFGAGHGIILTAPNNTRWLLTVNNSGNLITTPVS